MGVGELRYIQKQVQTCLILVKDMYCWSETTKKKTTTFKMAAGDSSACPQWPDRCCFCIPKWIGVVITGLMSVLVDTAFIALFARVLQDSKSQDVTSLWDSGYVKMENWILNTHWDEEVTHGALRFMNLINSHRDDILHILIFISGLHVLCCLLLLLCVRLQLRAPGSPRKRLLLLPWLTLDMFFIVLTTCVFVSWAFLSFFVHILVAIFFPVVSGGLLGLWIYSWRNVREWFIICGQRASVEDIDFAKGGSHPYQLYRKLPAQAASPASPAAQSPTTEMRIVPNYMHHQHHLHQHQVPVWYISNRQTNHVVMNHNKSLGIIITMRHQKTIMWKVKKNVVWLSSCGIYIGRKWMRQRFFSHTLHAQCYYIAGHRRTISRVIYCIWSWLGTSYCKLARGKVQSKISFLTWLQKFSLCMKLATALLLSSHSSSVKTNQTHIGYVLREFCISK